MLIEYQWILEFLWNGLRVLTYLHVSCITSRLRGSLDTLKSFVVSICFFPPVYGNATMYVHQLTDAVINPSLHDENEINCKNCQSAAAGTRST